MQARRFFMIYALAVSAALSFGCSSQSASEPATVAASESGEMPAAAPFSLQAADGSDVSLADFEGQVVLLNFWATWCGPCKIEMPWFVEFQREYKDRGFTVLAVSLDEGGWDVVRPFVDDMKPNFPILLGDDQLAEQYGGIMALPTTMVIDRDGRITSRHTGLVSKSEYVDDIEKLL